MTAEYLEKYTEKDLEQLVARHNRLYWSEGEPEISDQEYDLLLRRLEALNPAHPLLSELLSPKVASEGKVRHAEPMLSLAKAYSMDDLMAWAGKIARSPDETFLVEPKYDGISANFANGILATRGDGEEGENVSSKIPLIELEAPGYKGPLDKEARGEIVIRNDDFGTIYSNIKKKDGGIYKNSRNAVSGIMGLKEIDSMLRQGAKLTMVDYDLVSYRVKLSELRERWPGLLSEIEQLPYPMDGIVVKLADEAYRASLGNTAHHPRAQIAFKFTGIQKKTRLLDVQWSFGKNCLTPVAVLEPVELGGITIKHATLHNCQNVVDKDIKIGDMVTVERAGDVIPYILDSEPGESRRDSLISKCPCCRSNLVRVGPEICCINKDCPETNLQRLFASVRNIGIERLGEPNIRKMMNSLGVKNLKDIFSLTKEDILRLDGFKEKSAENLVNEIANAKNTNDYQILAALNIRGIGKNVARSILKKFTIAELRELSVEQLSEIDGVGPERAEALFSELRNQSNFLDELIAALNIQTSKTSLPETSSDKTKICFSGKMPMPRSHYEDLARERGLEPVDSVTSDTAILVLQDTSSSSSKAKKAAKLGITIMQTDEWLGSKENIPQTDPAIKSPPEARQSEAQAEKHGTKDTADTANPEQMDF
ncbi:MAG: hypothetical protein JW808_03550, partial [Victivallales bacterium]|nr:hypothetical protein [Victivallales bacterium]